MTTTTRDGHGFVGLFDGCSLDGWFIAPPIPVRSAGQTRRQRDLHRIRTIAWPATPSTQQPRPRQRLTDRTTIKQGEVMEYTRLGASGLKVSRISLGCMSYGDGSRGKWALDYDAAAPFVRQALELGITFWDTALAARPGQRGTSRNS
jgi:hypothetical protein